MFQVYAKIAETFGKFTFGPREFAKFPKICLQIHSHFSAIFASQGVLNNNPMFGLYGVRQHQKVLEIFLNCKWICHL
jgi:hypothetical protein